MHTMTSMYIHLYYVQFKEEHFKLRTHHQHLQHCASLDEDSTGGSSREYGVNTRSTLLDLQYFDVCSGTLLPDVMHDILEGALQYEFKLLIQYCIREQHYFSLTDLNTRLVGAELGYMESDRPAPIERQNLFDDTNSLKQKGEALNYTIYML